MKNDNRELWVCIIFVWALAVAFLVVGCETTTNPSTPTTPRASMPPTTPIIQEDPAPFDWAGNSGQDRSQGNAIDPSPSVTAASPTTVMIEPALPSVMIQPEPVLREDIQPETPYGDSSSYIYTGSKKIRFGPKPINFTEKQWSEFKKKRQEAK